MENLELGIGSLLDFDKNISKLAIEKGSSEGLSGADLRESELIDRRKFFLDRLGKLTASKVPAFMTKGKGKNWGETSMKVLYQLVVERTMSKEGIAIYIDELIRKDFQATAWGNKYELIAFEEIKKVYPDIQKGGFVLSPDIPLFGASPDFILTGSEVFSGEIKCPFDPVVHQLNLQLNEETFKKHDYYEQVQSQIIALKAGGALFCSFDPRREDKWKLKVLEVKKDVEFEEVFLERCEAGMKMVNEMIDMSNS